MKEKTKNLIQIHLSVFLFGFSALFGKYITHSPLVIIFGRTLFAAVTLLFILFFFKQNFKLKFKSDQFLLVLLGLILAIHWFSFFKSVQVSTVAVGVLTFSTYPIFVTFIEPLVFKEKIKIFDIIIALITFFGIGLIVPEFCLANNITQGVLWGVFSGFTCAVLSVFNKKLVSRNSSLLIVFYENLVSMIVSLPLVLFVSPVLESKDILLLLLLGTIFTALPHVLFVAGMTHIKAQLASIITTLEPFYSIVFALFLLGEVPTHRTILGGIVILSAVIFVTVKSK